MGAVLVGGAGVVLEGGVGLFVHLGGEGVVLDGALEAFGLVAVPEGDVGKDLRRGPVPVVGLVGRHLVERLAQAGVGLLEAVVQFSDGGGLGHADTVAVGCRGAGLALGRRTGGGPRDVAGRGLGSRAGDEPAQLRGARDELSEDDEGGADDEFEADVFAEDDGACDDGEEGGGELEGGDT